MSEFCVKSFTHCAQPTCLDGVCPIDLLMYPRNCWNLLPFEQQMKCFDNLSFEATNMPL